MVFENGVKNIQADAYNGARAVAKDQVKLQLLNIGSYTNLRFPCNESHAMEEV